MTRGCAARTEGGSGGRCSEAAGGQRLGAPDSPPSAPRPAVWSQPAAAARFEAQQLPPGRPAGPGRGRAAAPRASRVAAWGLRGRREAEGVLRGGGCRCRLNGGVEDPVPQSAPETATSRGVRTLPGAAPVAGLGPPGSAARTRRRLPPGQAGRFPGGPPRGPGCAPRLRNVSVCPAGAARGRFALLPHCAPPTRAAGLLCGRRSSSETIALFVYKS